MNNIVKIPDEFCTVKFGEEIELAREYFRGSEEKEVKFSKKTSNSNHSFVQNPSSECLFAFSGTPIARENGESFRVNKAFSAKGVYAAKVKACNGNSDPNSQEEVKALKKLDRLESLILRPLNPHKTIKYTDPITNKSYTYEYTYKLYVIQSLIPGENLRDFLEKNLKELTNVQKRQIAIKICLKLQALHNQGIIHGDLTPANIVIEKKNDEFEIEFVDFGNASVLESKGQTQARVDVRGGNAFYRAPELNDRKNGYYLKSFASDIYALGEILDDDMEMQSLPANMKHKKAKLRPSTSEILIHLLDMYSLNEPDQDETVRNCEQLYRQECNDWQKVSSSLENQETAPYLTPNEFVVLAFLSDSSPINQGILLDTFKLSKAQQSLNSTFKKLFHTDEENQASYHVASLFLQSWGQTENPNSSIQRIQKMQSEHPNKTKLNNMLDCMVTTLQKAQCGLIMQNLKPKNDPTLRRQMGVS